MNSSLKCPISITILILFLGCLGLAVSLPAFSSQTTSLWKNPPLETVLDNGLTVIFHKDDSSTITVVQIAIKGGKAAEPEGKSGLAYITTRLALEIPDTRKLQKMMSQASSVSLAAEGDYSLISIRSLTENLEETLKISSKILLKPLFSGIRIKRFKDWMLHRRKAQEDDAISAGHNSYLKLLFGHTGYGESRFGNEKSLKAIKTKDVKEFYKNSFKAGNMIIAVASDLEQEALIEIIKKYYSKLPPGKPIEPDSLSFPLPEERKLFIEKDTKQYFISSAFPLPKLAARNYTLTLLVENLLGKGVSSRLWSLRSEEELAYNVNSRAIQMKDGGILEAYLETDKGKKVIAIEALKKALDNLYENGITEEELETTKISLKGYLLRANETKEVRMRNITAFEALGLGYKFFHGFFEEIDIISLEEINAYIKDILDPEKRVDVIIGPKEET